MEGSTFYLQMRDLSSFRASRPVSANASGGPIFSALPEKMGKKRGAGLRLVYPAGAVHASTRFIVAASTHTHPTGAMVRAACYGTPNLQAAAIQYLRRKRFAFEICKAVQLRRSPLKASSCRVARGKRRLLAYRRPRSGKATASRRTQHQRFDGKKEETALEDKRLRKQRGLVPARPWLPGEPSISGSTGKKEETALEDKRLREQRGLVPARPFPTIRRRRSSGTLCRSSDRAAGCRQTSPRFPDSLRSVPHRPSRR